MSFLIDGYNLMHAVGSAPPPAGTRTQFDNARKRFLDWLADAPALRGVAVRVVFDAPNSRRDLGSTTHRRLVVTYSFRQTADDLIEALVRVEPHPTAVRVVSDDNRVLDAARRRGCRAWGCAAFVDWLLAPPTEAAKSAAEEKPQGMSTDELDELRKVFEKRG
ncbi:MAG: NYN domain-containing protein [Gemmataceae bacterium]